MPFTPAHAAAAFPFRRTGLIWSALVIGTMAPDIEYFLRLAPGQPYGHTPPGIFLVSLPLGLITLWLFHSFVKAPFVELLPRELECRLVPYMRKFQFGGASRFALIAASVLIGIFTHIAWDSFTHKNSPLVHAWPPLRYPVNLGPLGACPLYKLLQYGSSVFGLAVLAVAIVAWYRQAEPCDIEPNCSHRGWPMRRILTLLAISAIALVAGFGYAIWTEGMPSRRPSLSLFVAPLVITAMAAAWWQLVLLGIIRVARSRLRKSAAKVS
ncbi:MAG TPA: DUF4184 family protein [Terriglobales bacterium]|nr:DUF4184 family protein [Terriglobales bacterium]